MKWTSILSIYILFWTICLFIILPIGIRSHEEAGVRHGHGHDTGAPHQPRLLRKALWTTILSALLFGLFYANYVEGWIGPADVDWIHPPANIAQPGSH